MKTILVDAIGALVVKDEGVFEDMHALLETFPNRKLVLTGANDDQFTKFGLDKVPYEVFTLKHDPEKTDPAYFRILLKHYDLLPSDVVYFEHNKDAMACAQAVGITTMFYDEHKQDLAELKQFLETHLES
ncbi:hypothetical protein HJC99_06800 [Candidatus Saccharibacteria bacterium]|nr:hypothetical protein [Candidatus Saccharibacteria bacterium]